MAGGWILRGFGRSRMSEEEEEEELFVEGGDMLEED